MHKITSISFSQAKLEEISISKINNLFTIFKVHSLLSRAMILKRNGLQTIEMFYLFILLIFEKSKSVYSGLEALKVQRYETTLNNFLNNPRYNWRKLQLYIAKLYSNKYPPEKGKPRILIIDDTSKKKTGKLVEFISWFYDHSDGSYYRGYQTVIMAWSNFKTCIPIDFVIKTGKKPCEGTKRSNYDKTSHTYKRYLESQLTKTEISIHMIKRAMKHRIEFDYVLWDSWYNSSVAYGFIFDRLVPHQKHLITMVKLGGEKYWYNEQECNVKEICNSIKKWKKHPSSEIKFKSVMVEIIDKSDPDRTRMGRVKMCFYKFPGQKKNKYKAIICTNTELTELEILELYTQRWQIEVVIKDLKQYFGYNQSMSSKYAPQIADLTIRCICYIMICSLREKDPKRSMYQIVIEINNDFVDHCFQVFVSYVLKKSILDFIKYAESKGIITLVELIDKYEKMYNDFITSDIYEEKIIESGDKMKKKRVKRTKNQRVTALEKL